MLTASVIPRRSRQVLLQSSMPSTLFSFEVFMESVLAQYSLDEIQQLGQTIGGIIVAVLSLTSLFVCYRLIKRSFTSVSDFEQGMRDKYGENWEDRYD